MLLEFRVSNYRSFDEEQTFSFVASKDKTSLEDENVHQIGDHRILKAAALYGANASGKSNLIKALGAAASFISNSATQMNLGDEIAVEPFRLRKDARSEPSSFEFTLLIEGIRYDYGFSATRERVHDEWIIAYEGNKEKTWLDRSYDEENDDYEWDFDGPLKEEGTGLKRRTRSNGLALSRGVERNIKDLDPLFLWFKEKLKIVDNSIQESSPRAIFLHYSLQLLKENETYQTYAWQLLRDADVGIVDVAVRKFEREEIEIPDSVPAEIREKFLTHMTGQLRCSATHANHMTGEIAHFELSDESDGTRALLGISGPFWDTIQHGYTLVIDELERSLHPHLVRKLVGGFQTEKNVSGAQLLFATHDTSLLDLTLLRRDQIWLMEKTRSGATEMYSLYDFKDNQERPRNTEAIQRGYLGGRYGGVPNFGPSLESVR